MQQALGLGRACSLGHSCRRSTATTPSPAPPPLPPRATSKSGGRAVAVRAEAASSAPRTMEAKRDEQTVLTLRAVEATPESFAPFGQVIAASPDGDQFGPHDAQLDLTRGIPRFYIMRLESKPLKFSTITHHAGVTQCLGSIGGQDWYLGVAKPSVVDRAAEQSARGGRSPVQSRAGHFYLPPDPAEVCVFRVSGPKFLKLHTGTWHAGPLFKAHAVDFYNLELSDTNVVDHTTHYFEKQDGVTFVIED
ncbi:uncharacterized protein LOC124661055 [Lolium rigidum]|uniref:uncharacterized protein LOC124661055 n=1 Tax=Lolium rigidum TaxID=89674 RepID=UPI001F5D2377|nr:uncharacterized protein LOC124661055 [Lolium rigidum]